MATAVAIVNSRENALRERGLERVASATTERFKLAGASTGKGPAVKADTGDAETDVAAQAKMNHVRFFSVSEPRAPITLHSLCIPSAKTLDGRDQEPPRRLRQPGSYMAYGHADRVPRHVWEAGGNSNQEVRFHVPRPAFHTLTRSFFGQ
jgi:hypothetical protein